VFVCLFFIQTLPAHSITPLKFTAPKSDVLKLRIEKLRANSPQSLPFENITIAAADLNGDGLDEYITRPAECTHEHKNQCSFSILASAKNNELILIGKLNAREISLGDGYTHGVRNIRSYSNPLNDYEYQLYIWEPSQSRYILQQENR